MSASSSKLSRVTKTIADSLGVRFCTSCNKTRPVEGGKAKTTSFGRSRWMCAMCAERNKPSGFAKEKV